MSGESLGFSDARRQRPDLHVPFRDGARHVELQVGRVGVKRGLRVSIDQYFMSRRSFVDARSPFFFLFWKIICIYDER